MSRNETVDEASKAAEFVEAAAGRTPSLVAEFLSFLRDNKKWWLLPILAVLSVLGLLVVLGGTAVAPFIYTLF
jgi:hypothetical protein